MKLIFLLVLMFSIFTGAVYADNCISGDCQNGHGSMTYPDSRKYVGQ